MNVVIADESSKMGTYLCVENNQFKTNYKYFD